METTKTMKKTVLDRLSTAIERVVKGLKPAPTTKRMELSAFLGYAVDQIKKASEDEPRTAEHRLLALKRSVDGALATLAKLNAEDTDSEKVQVEVLTAWAPSKAEGDKPLDDLTTAEEQGSSEISPTAIAAAQGDVVFAENLGEVAKNATRAPDAGWPLNLNSAGFREGVEKADSPPEWGFDPAIETTARD